MKHSHIITSSILGLFALALYASPVTTLDATAGEDADAKEEEPAEGDISAKGEVACGSTMTVFDNPGKSGESITLDVVDECPVGKSYVYYKKNKTTVEMFDVDGELKDKGIDVAPGGKVQVSCGEATEKEGCCKFKYSLK